MFLDYVLGRFNSLGVSRGSMNVYLMLRVKLMCQISKGVDKSEVLSHFR